MTAVPVRMSGGSSDGVIVQLALAEARRLARHPIVLVGCVLSLVAIVAIARTPYQQAAELRFVFLSGAGVWPVAIGAFLAANLAAVRARRHGSTELEDTTVTGPARRTCAMLGAMVAPVLIGTALLATAVVTFQAWDGVPVRLQDRFVEHALHPAELLQGPLVIAFTAVLGVAFGRWVPSRILGPLMLVPAVVGFFQVTWRFDDAVWRFAPVMVHEQQVGWVQVTPSSGYAVLSGFHTTDLSWHLLYLVGLTVLLGAVAVARSAPSRRLAAIGVAGLLLATVGGVLQLP